MTDPSSLLKNSRGLRVAQIVLAAGPLGIVAAASWPPGAGIAEPAEPTSEGFLQGPIVSDAAMDSLVEVDMVGNFLPQPGRPDGAGLSLVLEDAQRREAVRIAIAARETQLGMLLIEHIDLVRDATDAMTAGDEQTVQAIYRRLGAEFDPEQRRDPILDRVQNALTPEELARVERLLDEYWAAWIDWELRDVEDPPDGARDEVQRRLTARLFQQELGEAYQWSLGPFRERLERIYEATEPTPEQRAAIRAAVIDHIRTARLEPTPEQRRETADRIYQVLDEEQRKGLFSRLLWNQR